MSKSPSVMNRILKELRPFTLSIIISILCAVIVVITTLLIPVLTGRAVDCIVGVGKVDFAGLAFVMRQMTAAITCTFIFQWIMNLINNRITYGVTRALRDKAFETLVKTPLSVIDTHGRGDYMSRIVTDADSFADGLLMGFNQLFTGVMTILGTIVFMLTISVPIALVVIVLTPLSLFIAKFIATRTFDLFKSQAQIRGQQTSFAEENIENTDLVALFAHQNEAIQKFDDMNEEFREVALKATFFSSLVNPTTRFVNSIIYAGVGVAGAMLAIGGNITVGALTSFLSYASGYAKPFNEISGVVTEMSNAIACATRLFEMIDAQVESECNDNHLINPKGEIEFKNVCFSYNKEKPLIENLNLSVKPGQKVAIVGPTGGGKSTIINLLMRFYDIDEGQILIDGIDISTVPRSEVRTAFGMVLQETWLKQDTVKENLLMSVKRTDEEMISIAKESHAHSFIKRLPKGYDTFLENGDGGLSEGQKQLMCIARVMMDIPPMLILDEATSSIDTRTETKIQSAFSKMMDGRTTFVVAHRLSTIKNSDIILFVKDGKIVEQGSHDNLLQQGGFYAKLYASQFVEN